MASVASEVPSVHSPDWEEGKEEQHRHGWKYMEGESDCAAGPGCGSSWLDDRCRGGNDEFGGKRASSKRPLGEQIEDCNREPKYCIIVISSI